MPCYCHEPTIPEAAADAIVCGILDKTIGIYDVRDYVFKLVTELEDLEEKNAKMGNMLCDLGRQFENNACGDIGHPEGFKEWWEEHKVRDKKKNDPEA